MKPLMTRMWIAAAVVAAAWAPLAAAQDAAKLVADLNNTSTDVRAEAFKSAGPYGAAAVLPVAELLASTDPEVAKAAAIALDNIADHAARPGAAAERAAVAAELAKLLDAGRPEPLRREAVRLLALVATDAEVPAMAALLAEPALAEDACQTLHQMGSVPVDGVSSAAAVEALAAALPAADGATKVRILAALADATAATDTADKALRHTAKTDDPEVKWAARYGLARRGVPPRTAFVNVKSRTPEEQERHFRACLIAADVLSVQDSLTDRAYHLYAYVVKNSPFVYQVEAALPKCAYDDVIPLAVANLSRPGVGPAAVRVLTETKAEGVEESLTKAYGNADPAAKAGMLQVLANRKSAAFPSLLTQAGTDPAPEVRLAATELSGVSPTPELLDETIRTGSPQGREHAAELALDLAAEREAADAAAAAAIYENLVVAELPREIKVYAFAGLERVPSPQVAEFLARVKPVFNASAGAPAAENAALVEEVKAYPPLTVAAGKAYAASCATLGKDQAVPELQAVIDSVKEYDIITTAVEKLAGFGLDPRVLAHQRGFVTEWQLLGPLPNADWSAAGRDFFTIGDGPMPDGVAYDGGTASVVAASTQGVPAVVNLRQSFKPDGPSAAYGYTLIKSDKEQPITLLVGSDDGCQVWLNGQKVLDNANPRSMAVDGDKAEAVLRAGDNHLLIKVLQASGDWQFVVRLTDREGRPIDPSAGK